MLHFKDGYLAFSFLIYNCISCMLKVMLKIYLYIMVWFQKVAKCGEKDNLPKADLKGHYEVQRSKVNGHYKSW